MIRLDLSAPFLLALALLCGVAWTLGAALTRRLLLIGLQWERRRRWDRLNAEELRRLEDAYRFGVERGTGRR